MSSISDLINGYGQIDYASLLHFASVNPLSAFTQQAPHPFLVGKDLYEGSLKTKIGGTLASTSTMKFSTAEFRTGAPIGEISDTKTAAEIDPHGLLPNVGKEREKILKSIYFLRQKGAPGAFQEGMVNIGRNGMNDIVILDSVISGKHAQISVSSGTYIMEDKNSTNGTFVNSERIRPGNKVQLKLNDEIAFGRIVFVFAHSLQVYSAMRKEILGY
ncbi:MAG: hypothetical protein A2020_06390 [Lentisphaerae bacterium GWF2_45_14]|nr:MAG: hypothetical protein A2020_06390 [Lentisphaerae bacterium GWF2_45_14]